MYYDEVNRNQLLSIRRADIELAFDLISKNRLSEADSILQHDDNIISMENLPYGMTSANNMHDRISLAFLQACILKIINLVFQNVETHRICAVKNCSRFFCPY